MKPKGSKGLLTKVYDRLGKLMSIHTSLTDACDHYGVNYTTLMDFKKNHPTETAYPVWAVKYTELKYTIHWGKK